MRSDWLEDEANVEMTPGADLYLPGKIAVRLDYDVSYGGGGAFWNGSVAVAAGANSALGVGLKFQMFTDAGLPPEGVPAYVFANMTYKNPKFDFVVEGAFPLVRRRKTEGERERERSLFVFCVCLFIRPPQSVFAIFVICIVDARRRVVIARNNPAIAGIFAANSERVCATRVGRRVGFASAVLYTLT